MSDAADDVEITMPHKLLKGDWFNDPREAIWEGYNWEREQEEPLALFMRDGLVFLLHRSAYTYKEKTITRYKLSWTKRPLGDESFHEQTNVDAKTAEMLLLLAPVVFPYAKRPAPKVKPDYS